MGAQTKHFSQALDAVDHLTAEEQEELVSIVRRRLADKGRRRVVADVKRTRKASAKRACKPSSIAGLMDEIES